MSQNFVFFGDKFRFIYKLMELRKKINIELDKGTKTVSGDLRFE